MEMENDVKVKPCANKNCTAEIWNENGNPFCSLRCEHPTWTEDLRKKYLRTYLVPHGHKQERPMAICAYEYCQNELPIVRDIRKRFCSSACSCRNNSGIRLDSKGKATTIKELTYFCVECGKKVVKLGTKHGRPKKYCSMGCRNKVNYRKIKARKK